ncbi:MAG: helix-turn-helix transcriptional regulator [Firmicutes bacterium]|nr:helix-turn-helix transcriptional regulator [Bacillota bacterium]
MPLNNKLKYYREMKNINQQDFGALVNVSRQTISSIERGDYSPSVTLALKIAKVLNVSVEEIFEYKEEENEK